MKYFDCTPMTDEIIGNYKPVARFLANNFAAPILEIMSDEKTSHQGFIRALDRMAERMGIETQPYGKIEDPSHKIAYICVRPLPDPISREIENAPANVDNNYSGMPADVEAVQSILLPLTVDADYLTACVLGRSRWVGKPMAEMLMDRNFAVATVHSGVPSQIIDGMVRSSTLIVNCTGDPEAVSADCLTDGTRLIDLSDKQLDQKLLKDKDVTVVKNLGSLTCAIVMKNVVEQYLKVYVDFQRVE